MKINDETHYLRRAVDHEGEVLESYVTKTRDKAADLRFLKKALKRHGKTEAITTDGLLTYRYLGRVAELGRLKLSSLGRAATTRDEFSSD